MNQYLIVNGLYKEIMKNKFIILIASILFGLPLIYNSGLYGAALTSIIYELIGLIYVIMLFIKTKNKVHLGVFMFFIEFQDGQGLGNQLWNYAALRSLSKELNYGYKVFNFNKFKGLDFLEIKELSNKKFNAFDKQK